MHRKIIAKIIDIFKPIEKWEVTNAEQFKETVLGACGDVWLVNVKKDEPGIAHVYKSGKVKVVFGQLVGPPYIFSPLKVVFKGGKTSKLNWVKKLS